MLLGQMDVFGWLFSSFLYQSSRGEICASLGGVVGNTYENGALAALPHEEYKVHQHKVQCPLRGQMLFSNSSGLCCAV